MVQRAIQYPIFLKSKTIRYPIFLQTIRTTQSQDPEEETKGKMGLMTKSVIVSESELIVVKK